MALGTTQCHMWQPPCPDSAPLSPEGHPWCQKPCTGCHTCLLASDLQNPRVNLLSAEPPDTVTLCPSSLPIASSKFPFQGGLLMQGGWWSMRPGSSELCPIPPLEILPLEESMEEGLGEVSRPQGLPAPHDWRRAQAPGSWCRPCSVEPS